MNSSEFETLLREAESVESVEISTHIAAAFAENSERLNERQRIDLIYLEYLSRQSRGESDVITDLRQRYPDLAAKLIRQVEVDTELSRLDETTESHDPVTDANATIDKIGEYTVVEKIGEGAQAEVFRVIHPMLRCELAMKVSKRATEATDRILDEGRLLVTINDAGVARVIDAGVWKNRQFIVSELIRGKTLKQRIDDGTLTRVQFVELLMRLGQTVETLHSAGIVHCDIKSTNVLVDSDGLPKLVDFGLAIDRRVDAWDDDAACREDHAGGTLVYMAPELFQPEKNGKGSHSRLPVSDVFSLGGLLYFGLVGNHPYAASSSQNVIERVATGNWDRDTLRSSGAPATLIRLCEASMAFDPQQRTESADSFANELRQWLQGQNERPRWLCHAFVGIGVVLLALVSWIAWQRIASQPNVALPFANVPGATTVEMERLGPLDVKIWSEESAFELVHRVPIASGEGLQVNAPLRAGRSGELWLVSSEGNAERLASFPKKEKPRWVHYPAKLDQAAPLTGPAGTEAIVWLELPGQRDPSCDDDRIANTLRPGEQWPSIGDALVFRLVDGRLNIEQDDRSLGLPQDIEAPSAIVQEHLRRATGQLNKHGIRVEIVAFSHTE